jgi:repressor LexA
MISLTQKQRELLTFLRARVGQTGVAPSFEEIKDELDLASKSSVHRLLQQLEDRGAIRRLPHRARAIEIMGDAAGRADARAAALRALEVVGAITSEANVRLVETALSDCVRARRL